MKVSAVSLLSFRSQNAQKDNVSAVDPYLYTSAEPEKKHLNGTNFSALLGIGATLAVVVTLYKIFGKKIL